MIFLSEKLGGENWYIDVLCVQKSFCSGAGVTEPKNPPLRL